MLKLNNDINELNLTSHEEVLKDQTNQIQNLNTKLVKEKKVIHILTDISSIYFLSQKIKNVMRFTLHSIFI